MNDSVPSICILQLRHADRAANPDGLFNKVVFDSVDPSPYQTVAHPSLIGCPGADPALASLPWFIPRSSNDTTLVFESRFESGNLRRAVQVTPFEYGR